jgi:putative transposase
MTGYDTDGFILEFRKGDMNTIFKHLYRADKLQSVMEKKKNTGEKNHKQRQSMRKRIRRTIAKVKDKIRDAHHKISKYLCENYDSVLLPTFGTSGMIKSSERKIRSKTVRQMCTWSHYKFKNILNAKSKRYGSFIAPCDEDYTSKTCSSCGNINHKLTGEKEYKCSECGMVFDRDFNASKNILIKFLCKYTSTNQPNNGSP